MNEQICQRIENSAHFKELVAARQRFAAILSLIMLVIYVGFILLIAFAPAGWARRCMRNQRHPGYSDWYRRDRYLFRLNRNIRLAGKW
ncbi:membrane protein [Klebsiella michiganensis]|uniref:Membrane protein n=1 Tax=Klebsiella michiganensis TaxID=1134687 RepID=A0A7H4M1W6_9ENTR|nr:membrane protein [Klebsiella michiganensis]